MTSMAWKAKFLYDALSNDIQQNFIVALMYSTAILIEVLTIDTPYLARVSFVSAKYDISFCDCNYCTVCAIVLQTTATYRKLVVYHESDTKKCWNESFYYIAILKKWCQSPVLLWPRKHHFILVTSSEVEAFEGSPGRQLHSGQQLCAG